MSSLKLGGGIIGSCFDLSIVIVMFRFTMIFVVWSGFGVLVFSKVRSFGETGCKVNLLKLYKFR